MTLVGTLAIRRDGCDLLRLVVNGASNVVNYADQSVSPKIIVTSPEYFCLSVCLSVSNITRKVENILGVIGMRCRWLHSLSALAQVFSLRVLL